MKKLIVLLITLLCLFTALPAMAADCTLFWASQADATGFRVYRSVDMGVSWTMVQEVGNVTQVALTGQPDTGIVLYRIAAINVAGETIRRNAGQYLWKDAPAPPVAPAGTGID